MSADLVLTNARVLTMDHERPRAEAIALRGERVHGIGTNAEMAALAGTDTQIIDTHGTSVLPGFIESHLHLFMGGAELAHLQLGTLHGFDAVADATRRFAAEHPDHAVLMAQGADYGLLDRPMTRHDLDKIIEDRPFAIGAADHHTVWANTTALRRAGLLHGFDAGPGNEVVMGTDGLATGELREFGAFGPVMELAGEARVTLGIRTGEEPDPVPGDAQRLADQNCVARGLAHLARHGITSAVNMDGNRYTLELLQSLADQQQLTARVRVPFHFKPHMDTAALSRALEMSRHWKNDWLSCGFVKLFMDGVIDSGTAAMLHDYPGKPGHRGDLLFDTERFAGLATEIDRLGLQMAVHAIGDAAVRNVIDGYAAARRVNGPRDSRHRIEHIELIDPFDVPRLAELDIVASVQPCHAPGALDFPLQPTLSCIERHRWEDAFRCRSLAQAGARLAFASDWPVADVSVLRGIQAAVTRAPFDRDVQCESVSLMQALEAYTIGGAHAEHTEHCKGKLAPGYLADVVVLSADIEAVAPERIETLDVAMTICGGRIVYRRANA